MSGGCDRLFELAAAATLLAGTAFACYAIDLPALFEVERHWQDAERRRVDLERARRSILLNTAAKRRVAARLLCGQLTLLEAAVSFEAIDEALPMTRRNRASGSRREQTFGCVIRYVEAALEGRPEQAEQVARLEAELENFRASGRN